MLSKLTSIQTLRNRKKEQPASFKELSYDRVAYLNMCKIIINVMYYVYHK